MLIVRLPGSFHDALRVLDNGRNVSVLFTKRTTGRPDRRVKVQRKLESWRIEWELPMRHSGSGQTEWYLLWKNFSFAPRNQAALDHGRSKATTGVAGNGDVSGRILVFRIVQEEFSVEELVTWVLSQEIDLDVAIVVSERLKPNLRNVSSA